MNEQWGDGAYSLYYHERANDPYENKICFAYSTVFKKLTNAHAGEMCNK